MHIFCFVFCMRLMEKIWKNNKKEIFFFVFFLNGLPADLGNGFAGGGLSA